MCDPTFDAVIHYYEGRQDILLEDVWLNIACPYCGSHNVVARWSKRVAISTTPIEIKTLEVYCLTCAC